MSLSKCINPFERRIEMAENQSSGMDALLLSTSEVEVKTSKVIKKRAVKRLKKPNPKFYKYLLKNLEERKHRHMLKYVPDSNESEFEITFTNKKNKGVWKKKDVSLFMDVDHYLKKAFNRKRAECDEQVEFKEVKTRFKSNLNKCLEQKFIELIDDYKIQKCVTVKKYRILLKPECLDEKPTSKNAKRKLGNHGNLDKKRCKKDSTEEVSVHEENNGKTICFKSVHQEVNYKNEIRSSEKSIPLKENWEISYFGNAHQDDKKLNMPYCATDKEKISSHCPCLIPNSENMEIDRKECVNSDEVINMDNDPYHLISSVDLKDLVNIKDFSENVNFNPNVVSQPAGILNNTSLDLDAFENFNTDNSVSSKNSSEDNAVVEINSLDQNGIYGNINIGGYVSSGDLNFIKTETTTNLSENLDIDVNFNTGGYVSNGDLNYEKVETTTNNTLTENLDTIIVTVRGSQENRVSKNGKYLIDDKNQIEPEGNLITLVRMSAVPFWKISGSLGDFNDWMSNYQKM